ncbi:hypothetical protein ACFYN9_39775 [Streptomyces collinus]|uniref:hypothetical protein n=1 Tax=Streptomyces collinus TaxID=42684 RepID=UPI00368B0860
MHGHDPLLILLILALLGIGVTHLALRRPALGVALIVGLSAIATAAVVLALPQHPVPGPALPAQPSSQSPAPPSANPPSPEVTEMETRTPQRPGGGS